MKRQKITKPSKVLMGTFVLLVTFCGGHSMPCVSQRGLNIAKLERTRVLKAANDFLKEAPITITASLSPRSAGGRHDYFSEGDYWWPDPQNPDGPYIQRDGMSNPNNFVDHRRYLIRMSIQVPALVAAWQLTQDRRYASHAVKHLQAWFIDEQTRMNPNLQYAQAIHGSRHWHH
jgi:alginate lyase